MRWLIKICTVFPFFSLSLLLFAILFLDVYIYMTFIIQIMDPFNFIDGTVHFRNSGMKVLILSARQTKTNTCASSVDPTMRQFVMSSLIRIYTVSHFVFDFGLNPLFTSVVKSKFKNGKSHSETQGKKGLMLRNQQYKVIHKLSS